MARSCTVFVGNLPYDASEEDLKQIFGRAGQVESLRLVYDKDTKQPKGYAFCDYSSSEEAIEAVKTLTDVECNGRRLRVDLADNSLRGREGKLPDVRLPVPTAMPTTLPALPAAEAQPRPSLPPASVGQLSAPPPSAVPSRLLPTPSGTPGAPGAAPAAPADGPSPEAILAAVSAHTEIAQTIAAMPPAQLQLVLGNMQRLAKEAPEGARALLQDNPQLCYALLHAQLLLGLTTEAALPPDLLEMQQLRMEAQRRPMGGAPRGAPRPPAPAGLMNFPGMIPPRPTPGPPAVFAKQNMPVPPPAAGR